MKKEDDDESILYNIIIKKFEMLRLESNQRLGYYIQIFQIYMVGLTAFYGYIFANRYWDVLLLSPFMSVPLYLRVIWDQKVLFFISDYTKENLDPWFVNKINCIQKKQKKETVQGWRTWDTYFRQEFNKVPPFYKHSIFITYGIISFCPSIVYCIYNLVALRWNYPLLTQFSSLHLETHLFVPLMWISGAIFSGMLYWIFRTTYIYEY